jgi:hypothetical protein
MSKLTLSRPVRALRLSITSLHIFKIKKWPQKQYTMVETMLTHPRLAREAGHELGRTISKFPRWVHLEQLQSNLELTQGIQRRRT